MSDCIFCQIASGKLPCKKVYENDYVFAFYDIAPMSNIHILVIPKQHTKNVNDLIETKDGDKILSEVYKAIKNISIELDVEKPGFRIVTNINQFAGQTVFHTHFHLLAGEKLSSFGA